MGCLDKHLVFGERSNDEGAYHSRQGAHSIGDAHENTGISWSYVQMVYIETCYRTGCMHKTWSTFVPVTVQPNFVSSDPKYF